LSDELVRLKPFWSVISCLQIFRSLQEGQAPEVPGSPSYIHRVGQNYNSHAPTRFLLQLNTLSCAQEPTLLWTRRFDKEQLYTVLNLDFERDLIEANPCPMSRRRFRSMLFTKQMLRAMSSLPRPKTQSNCYTAHQIYEARWVTPLGASGPQAEACAIVGSKETVRKCLRESSLMGCVGWPC
jgi:hypothetical protein